CAREESAWNLPFDYW
nr:immunoglobulin heavy chain junction region [Macaca mulatta]MOW22185.1 immunoglobulin heavy chain junction region [Macaca mulatta]